MKVELNDEKYSEAIASARACLTEVCSESSLQPLLQLYLVLPCLLTHMTCPDWNTPLSSAFTLYNIQLYSIVLSVLSLAWSFTAYIASQKKGALSFQNNFTGRILLLLWCIFQICGRLLLLTLMGYLFQNFWSIICLVTGHVVVMWLFFFYQNWSKGKTKNVLLNSFANIYLQILIKEENVTVNSNSEEKVAESSKSNHWFLKILRQILRQRVIVNGIHIVENLAMLIALWAYFKENVTVCIVAFCAFVATILGLILKMIYYNFFHIWRDIEKYQNKTQKNDQPPQFVFFEDDHDSIEDDLTEDNSNVANSIEVCFPANCENKAEMESFIPKQSKKLKITELRNESKDKNIQLVKIQIHRSDNI